MNTIVFAFRFWHSDKGTTKFFSLNLWILPIFLHLLLLFFCNHFSASVIMWTALWFLNDKHLINSYNVTRYHFQDPFFKIWFSDDLRNQCCDLQATLSLSFCSVRVNEQRVRFGTSLLQRNEWSWHLCVSFHFPAETQLKYLLLVLFFFFFCKCSNAFSNLHDFYCALARCSKLRPFTPLVWNVTSN